MQSLDRLGTLEYYNPLFMTAPRNSQRSTVPGPVDATDPQSFAAHFREAYPRLALVAAGVLGHQEAAEDIVQDAAIIAFRKAKEFVPGSNFAAWLAEIVRRCALNQRRKTQHRKTFAADPARLAQMNDQVAAGPGPSPISTRSGEILDDQAAFDDELVGALNQLSEDARCCLLLRTVEQMSYAEIAALMQIPEGTAMSHVHRSRTVLREILSRRTSVGGDVRRGT